VILRAFALSNGYFLREILFRGLLKGVSSKKRSFGARESVNLMVTALNFEEFHTSKGAIGKRKHSPKSFLSQESRTLMKLCGAKFLWSSFARAKVAGGLPPPLALASQVEALPQYLGKLRFPRSVDGKLACNKLKSLKRSIFMSTSFTDKSQSARFYSPATSTKRKLSFDRTFSKSLLARVTSGFCPMQGR